MRNGTQLIAYADRLAGDGLTTLREILTDPLDGVFTGIHILLFFTPYDGTDAGFDPVELNVRWEKGGAFVHARIDVEAGTFALDRDGVTMSDWDQF